MTDMTDILAGHQQKVGVRDMRSHCWCGWAGEMTGRAFIEHQAAALSAAGFGLVNEARAGTWDDGAHAALIEEGYIVTAHAAIYQLNPYRSEPMSEQAVTADAPTRCAHTQEPMTWTGSRWIHQPGICEDKGHS